MVKIDFHPLPWPRFPSIPRGGIAVPRSDCCHRLAFECYIPILDPVSSATSSAHFTLHTFADIRCFTQAPRQASSAGPVLLRAGARQTDADRYLIAPNSTREHRVLSQSSECSLSKPHL